MRPRRGHEAGFTLLESVIAMSVLAIGLLGLAAMQTLALTRNVDAKELGIATNLASEMVERIHSNRVNVTVYNGIDTNNGVTQPPASERTANGDYAQWQANLNGSGLDNVRGQVAVVNPFGPVALNQSQVQVTLTWMTKRGTGGGGSDWQGQQVSRVATLRLLTVVTPP